MGLEITKRSKINEKRRKLAFWKFFTKELKKAKNFCETKLTQKAFFLFYCKCKEIAKGKEVIKLVDAQHKVNLMRKLVMAWKMQTVKNTLLRVQRRESISHMIEYKKHQVLKAWFNSHDISKTERSGAMDRYARQLIILRTKCFKAWLLRWRELSSKR